MNDIFITLLYIVFVVSAIALIVVILLQEGRGGGFGQALGEHGQQTFGVGAKGINKVTGYLAFVFLGTAVVLTILNRGAGAGSVLDGVSIQAPPVDPTQPAPQPGTDSQPR
jgi:preprotein translocase subunit SecG